MKDIKVRFFCIYSQQIALTPQPPAPSPKGEGEPDQSPSSHLGEGFRVRAVNGYIFLRGKPVFMTHPSGKSLWINP
jgi:hypothetical protein